MFTNISPIIRSNIKRIYFKFEVKCHNNLRLNPDLRKYHEAIAIKLYCCWPCSMGPVVIHFSTEESKF